MPDALDSEGRKLEVGDRVLLKGWTTKTRGYVIGVINEHNVLVSEEPPKSPGKSSVSAQNAWMETPSRLTLIDSAQ